MTHNHIGLLIGNSLFSIAATLTNPLDRRKPQHKKHKTWDGDAYVTSQGSALILVSEHGKMWAGIVFSHLTEMDSSTWQSWTKTFREVAPYLWLENVHSRVGDRA